MRVLRRRLAGRGVLGLLCAAAGCGRAPALEPEVAMSFQVIPAARDTVIFGRTGPEPGRLPPTRAEGEAGVLRVVGYFETPCAGETVRGTVSATGATVRIRVVAERQGGTCATRTDPYVYEGMIHRLSPGTHKVLVEHQRDARRPDGPVLDTTVVLQG